MLCIRALVSPLLIVMLLLGSTGIAAADEIAPAVEKRIAAVENGLVPTVRVKGRTTGGKIAERMQHYHVPGVSVAVVNEGRIDWAKGYGQADSERGTTVTTDTRFQAASVSKPISALAVLRLVQDGMLALDRNVNEQLTSWKVPDNKYTAEHAVDLRGIMSHTAGLTVHGFPGYAVGKSLPSVPEILDGKQPANTQPVRVNKVPGSGFRYAGGGTTVMQQLVVDVTGRPFAEFMRDTVLVPLEMRNSTYEQPIPETLEGACSSAHDAQGKPIEGRWVIHPEMAAAGLWTTPSDVARYAIEVQQAHAGKSERVIKQKLIDEMLTPQGGGQVGLGPFMSDTDGQRRFSHGGQNRGFSCFFIGFVDRGQGAVVMSNSDVGSPLVREVVNAIAVAYDWPGYLPAEREAIRVDPAMLERYTGKYSANPLGTFIVSRRGEQLFAKPLVGPEIEMYLESEHKFFTEQQGVSGQFVVGESGPAGELVITAGDNETRAKRVEAKPAAK